MDGVGLALVKGDGIAAFDLDNCLDADGEVLPDHAGFAIAQEAERRGAYVEISPSLKGLRVIGPSDIVEAYSKDGLEYWGAGRYVTITGAVWANPNGWKGIQDLREPLQQHGTKDYEETESIVSRREIEELRSALSFISSDERGEWIRIGMALKGLGSRGFELWDEWSQKSDLYDAADCMVRWEGFRPSHTGYKAVFAEAQRNGWENPRGKKDRVEDEDDEEEVQSLLTGQMDLGEMELTATEFVIDGFMPTGVSLIAGAWGAGKSTNLIPVFAGVAHLTPKAYDSKLWPTLRRKVLWVTEAPDQARDTLYSLASSTFTEGESLVPRKPGERDPTLPAPWGEFKEWFRVVPAKRTAPKKIAKQIRESVNQLSYTLPNGFVVQPVVVLDTVSATLDLENESDNSEVGAAMSVLKENLRGVPLVLVGHTPKAVADQNEGLTFRGAGAWEADSVATYFLTNGDGIRMLALKKSRFAPSFTAISFGTQGGQENIDTPWGETQQKTFVHGTPMSSSVDDVQAERKNARNEERDAERSERALAADDSRMEVVSDLVSEYFSREEPLPLTTLMDVMRTRPGGSGNRTDQKRAIDLLVQTDEVELVDPPADLRELWGSTKGRPPKIVIPRGDREAVFNRYRSSKKPLASANRAGDPGS